jgi:ubiquinone/menaquinone biosynthesis C-methylase UbiE
MTCDHQNHKEICKFDTVSLYSCDKCGLVFTDKYGKDINAESLYEAYYKKEIGSRFNFIIEYAIRLFRLFRAFKISTIYPRAKTILDIGSGRGYMLYYLKKYFKYKSAVGTQISKNAYDFSREKLGLEIFDKDLLELNLSNTYFDIISMWHVLEHVPEPEKYIERIFTLLNNRGKLVIEVPNFNSWTRPLTRKYWLGLDLDYHMIFFTPESLSTLLKKYNFKIKTVQTFSLEYSTFISVQSFISLFTRSNHLFFQYLQTSGSYKHLILHVLLFIMLTPVCFLINILLYFSRRGEVLLIIAEKVKKL